MNRYNFKNRFVLLLLGFSLFYIQAAGKDPIENKPSVKNEQTADPRPMGAFIPNTKNTLEKSNVLKSKSLFRQALSCTHNQQKDSGSQQKTHN